MRLRVPHAVLGLVLALLVAHQVVLPELAEDRVADRLTEQGGGAEVSISSFPAARLLFGGRGERIEVRGRGIEVDPFRGSRDVLDRLDDFDEVDVRIERLSAGPVRGSFSLTRADADVPYRLSLRATLAPEDVARFAGEQLGGALGGLAGGFLPLPDQAVVLAIDSVVESDDGRPVVVEGEGTLQGIPLGPLTELVIGAVVSRLQA